MNRTAYLYFYDASPDLSIAVDWNDDLHADQMCEPDLCTYISSPDPLIVRVNHFTNYMLNSTAGNVTLISPPNGSAAGFAPTLSCSFKTYNPFINVINLTLYVNGNPVYSVANTTTQNNISLNYTYYITNATADYTWNCLGINELNQATFHNPNWTFRVAAIDNVTYNGTAYETEQVPFAIYWSASNSSITTSVHLIYDGTRYAVPKDNIVQNGSNFSAVYLLDIPTIDSSSPVNKTFYWEIRMAESLAYPLLKSSEYNITILPLNFSSSCSSPTPYPLLNVSSYGEEYRRPLQVDLYKAEFRYWLGNGTSYKTFNHSITNFTSQLYCVNNNTLTYKFWISYELKSAGLGTVNDNNRLYIFPNEQFNATNISEMKLYMLNVTRGRAVKVLAMVGGSLISGAEVKIYRYYPDLKDFILVHNGVTGYFGYWVSKLIENEVLYKIHLYKKGVINKSFETKVFCETGMECKIEGNTQEGLSNSRLTEWSDADQSLKYDEATRTFVYTIVDSSESRNALMTLKVFRLNFENSSENPICTDSDYLNSTQHTVILSCQIPDNMTGKFYASVYIKPSENNPNGEEYVVLINGQYRFYASIEEENLRSPETLFISFILLMMMIAIGAFYPIVGIGLFLVGYIGLSLMGLIGFDLPVFFAVLVIGVAFIWALARRDKRT